MTQAANGTVTPRGPLTVPHGASRTFTITAGGHYQVSDIRLDGISVNVAATGPAGDGSYSYTLSNITTAHTITASFALAPTSST